MGEDKGGTHSSDGTFEARLKTARTRHGLDTPAPGQDAARDSGNALGSGLRVGVELVSALVVALAIGWGLDRWLHTMPLFLVIFVLLGGAAGVANVWRMVSPPTATRRRT
jgi:ATP synthase protein I